MPKKQIFTGINLKNLNFWREIANFFGEKFSLSGENSAKLLKMVGRL